ncbi:MAG TPA: RNA polymerase sigma factor RpoD/SigA [Anaerolineales bacterium]|nr:RNA polymerase sigma factor RpoD/SigA [Anaerolineales bacterium]
MLTSTKPLQRILGEQTPLPLLNHAEEITLAHRVAAGHAAARQLAKGSFTPMQGRALRHRRADGEAAREALVLHNLRLVLTLAGRFRNDSLTYDDLVQEGIFGLIKAADRYDPKRGTRFATFAVWWIRQSMGRAIANLGRSVRLPVNRVHKISQIKRAAAQMAQQMGDEPPLETVAQTAGVTEATAAALLQDGQEVISLDAPVAEDDRSAVERLADQTAIDPESAVSENTLKQIIERSLARLDEREAEILRLRFGLGGGEARPLRAIASAWQMSPEGVRQISERALSHLRSMSEVRGLTEYLRES